MRRPLARSLRSEQEKPNEAQWANSIKFKGMRQINLVRAALPFIADQGPFTLVTGAPSSSTKLSADEVAEARP
jgi:hypothetical protein